MTLDLGSCWEYYALTWPLMSHIKHHHHHHQHKDNNKEATITTLATTTITTQVTTMIIPATTALKTPATTTTIIRTVPNQESHSLFVGVLCICGGWLQVSARFKVFVLQNKWMSHHVFSLPRNQRLVLFQVNNGLVISYASNEFSVTFLILLQPMCMSSPSHDTQDRENTNHLQ